jgi:hypothetical protein
MECNKESHRSSFPQYSTCLPRLLFMKRSDYTPQTDSWHPLSSMPAIHVGVDEVNSEHAPSRSRNN